MNSVNATFIKVMGIAILSVGLYACGGGDGDLPSTATDIPLPAAPGTGTDSGSTTDTSGTETSPGVGVATINWTPPTENTDGTSLVDLAGYKIYYGTAPDSLHNNVIINNTGLTSYVIDNLENNTTYYFSITAVNSKGIESPFSNIVSKQASG
jgi:hypothetical protein